LEFLPEINELPTEHECLANNGIVLYLRLFKKHG